MTKPTRCTACTGCANPTQCPFNQIQNAMLPNCRCIVRPVMIEKPKHRPWVPWHYILTPRPYMKCDEAIAPVDAESNAAVVQTTIAIKRMMYLPSIGKVTK